MKYLTEFFLAGALIGLPFAGLAQEEPGGIGVTHTEESFYYQPGFSEDEEEPPPPADGPRFHHPQRRRKGESPGFPFKHFRNQIRDLGREIRENRQLIRSLEEELEAMPPGVARAEVRKKLAEAERYQSELELTLARRRVEISKRGRDIAQERYDDARLELERVRRKIRKHYPELVPPKISPQ